MSTSLIGGIVLGLSLLAIPKGTKTPEIGLMYLYRTPLTQWKCTENERREYLGACHHREWSERNIYGNDRKHG